MPQPNKIPLAFAASGDKNAIPESTETTGLASWREGFPAITSAPFSEGGIAPKRADFNGIFNALSQAVMWMQQGGLYAYDVNTDYETGNVVLDAGGLYVANAANGPSSAVVQPSSDTTGAMWKLVRLDLATQSVAGYMSGADKTKLDGLISTDATQSAAGYMSASDKTKLDGIDIMIGATAGDAGEAGLVPAPSAGNQAKALLGSGGWGGLTDITGTLSIAKGGTGQTTAYNAYKAFINGSSTEIQYASKSSAVVNSNPQFWYGCTGIVVYVGVYFQLVNALSPYSEIVVATGFPLNACAKAGGLTGLHCIAYDNIAQSDCGISINSSGNCMLYSRATSIPANTWLFAEFVYPRSL